MKYVIDIPEEIEQALEHHASVTGEDVVHLIQMAVVSFVRSDVRRSFPGRRPDLPLDAIDTAPPFDLPRTAPRSMPIQNRSQRRPDPISDQA